MGPRGDRLDRVRRSVRSAVVAHRLDRLNPRLRGLVVVLVGVSVTTMIIFAVVTLGPPSQIEQAGPGTRLLVTVLALGGLGLGVAVFGATRVPPATASRAARRVARLTDGLLTAAALAVPLTLVLIDAAAAVGLPPIRTAVLRGLLWLALAASLHRLLVRRPATNGTRAVDVERFVALALPIGLVLVAVLVTLVISGSASATVSLTAPGSAVAGLAAIVIVPAKLVGQAVEGIADDRTRGIRLSTFTQRRPWATVAVLVLKVVVIAVLGLGVPALTGTPAIGSSPIIWLGSAAVAAMVVVLLTAERQLGLSVDDSPAVARLAMRLFAAPLTAVVLMSWAVGVLPQIRSHGGALMGLAMLTALIVVQVRLRPSGTKRLLGWLVPVAAVASSVLADTISRALPTVSSDGVPAVTVLVTVVALAAGLAVGLVTVVVWALATRQRRLLLYFAAVVGWLVIRAGLELAAPGTTALNLDLALTLMLLVAALLWVRGRQRVVDGFEVVVTAVVLLALIEVPIALDALPEAAERWLVTSALLVPGLLALWRDTRNLRDATGRSALRALALTSLGYALLVGLVWIVGRSGGDTIDLAASVVTDYLAVPIALLFVAAASNDRARAAPPQLTRPD